MLERKGDLTAISDFARRRARFSFLDEIQSLAASPSKRFVSPAMEDFRVDSGHRPGTGRANSSLSFESFHAHRRDGRAAGLITAPLRSRFGIVHRLDFYEPEDLLIILHRSARILSIEMGRRRRRKKLRVAAVEHTAHRGTRFVAARGRATSRRFAPAGRITRRRRAGRLFPCSA